MIAFGQCGDQKTRVAQLQLSIQEPTRYFKSLTFALDSITHKCATIFINLRAFDDLGYSVLF